MANFKEFRTLLQKHFDEMVKDGAPLFITNADEDKLYDLYLDSFPAGTNPIFRKRREYDCSCCRRFVKNIGKLVSFMDGQMVTIWDFDTKSDVYQPVVDALAAYVKTCAVVNPYYVSRNMIFAPGIISLSRFLSGSLSIPMMCPPRWPSGVILPMCSSALWKS